MLQNTSGFSCESNNDNGLWINTFFDKILVMDKDPDIRDNRLALLQKIKALFDSLGDFSKILED